MISEEEKKAIKWLEKAEFFSERLYAPIILNLIEKQREEIEKNQKFKEDVVNLIMLWDEEDLPENDRVIECLDTIMSEVSRLEDIEDRKIQVAVGFVEEKRDKHWEKKIEEKIKELEDYMILFTNDKEKFNRYKYARNTLEKLLKENNND